MTSTIFFSERPEPGEILSVYNIELGTLHEAGERVGYGDITVHSVIDDTVTEWNPQTRERMKRKSPRVRYIIDGNYLVSPAYWPDCDEWIYG